MHITIDYFDAYCHVELNILQDKKVTNYFIHRTFVNLNHFQDGWGKITQRLKQIQPNTMSKFTKPLNNRETDTAHFSKEKDKNNQTNKPILILY